MFNEEVAAIKAYKALHPKKRIYTVKFYSNGDYYYTPYYPKRCIKILHEHEIDNPKYKKVIMYTNNTLELVLR